uniref:putative GEM-like protein 8 n=1 Tax=Erigeron canadensis TaxID=72917 RepID=UPI001CB8B0E5|nr:putative GEM-like protein 8 [Erigeron canadensis]
MDQRLLNHVIGVPVESTRGLLSSKPYNQPHYPVAATHWESNGSFGPKLIKIVKQKLSNGARIVQFGSQGKTFRKNFSIKEGEKLLQTSQCYLYTTAGAIAGLLFVSTERVAFCSNKSIKTYSTTGELLKFQYKVSIPLSKIKGAHEIKNMKRPSNNYVELVTVDDFNFWFMGFGNSKKTLRYLHPAN